MLGVCQWRHGAFCVSRQHRLRGQWPRHILMCFKIILIVCESKFIIGESRTIFHANDTQAQQVAPNPRQGRFSTETPLEGERRPQIQREQRRRRRQQETVEQKEHCLAQRRHSWRQRRQLEAEEQEIGIRGIMIVHCRKPIPADICRSKSAKFQLCITARTIIINFSGELHRAIFVLCFCLFLNPDAEIMLNLLFNALWTITPHNT